MDARVKFRHLRPGNVELLKAKIEQVNKDATKTYEKLSLLTRSRISLHDAQMQRIHFVIWLDASRKYQETSRKLLGDLQILVHDNIYLNSFPWDDEKSSLAQVVEAHSLGLEKFVTEVIQPLNHLRLELKKSLQSNKKLRAALRDAYTNIETQIFDLLQCEVEINAFQPLSRLDNIRRVREDSIEDERGGIPTEAWQWDTHDEKFRADLLSEFVQLDAAFTDRVKGAKKEFINLENDYCLNEWRMEDFRLVEFLWDGKLLDFFCDHDVLKVKLEDTVLAWTRARQELADRIHVTLEDAMEEYYKKNREKASVEKQRVLCQQLTEKVQRWRKEKAELEELEFRAREANRVAAMAKEKRRQEREGRRRQIIKNKIQMRQESKRQEKAEFEAAEHLRLEMLRRVFDKQRHQDTRRLLEIARKRLNQQSTRRLEASEEAARRAEAVETRLESIRAKVIVKLMVSNAGHFIANALAPTSAEQPPTLSIPTCAHSVSLIKSFNPLSSPPLPTPPSSHSLSTMTMMPHLKAHHCGPTWAGRIRADHLTPRSSSLLHLFPDVDYLPCGAD
ncbi:unnamed protein product [Hydatigera taeniaeformis]|uniref:WW domain-containing protein n=1 Tax=Hydatigena taeniaeformis TaxID=6205 RepID=A0A0R3WQG4_HYDTA|nr:unnamed protein product [Hydatigera taeniaeformis]